MNESTVLPTPGFAETTHIIVDQNWKGIYRIGGLSLAAGGILYLLGTSISFYPGGGTPGNDPASLQALAAPPAISPAIYWIFLLADIAFLPATVGLFLALKEVNKSAMLVAAGLLACFVILDLGVTESNTLALVTLAQSIATASSDAQRAAYQAAANWGLATLPIATFFSWIGPSAGFLIASIVMRKAVFSRSTAVMGMIVYGVAIVASFYFLFPVPALGILLTPILWLYGFWLIKAGRELYRLGKP